MYDIYTLDLRDSNEDIHEEGDDEGQVYMNRNENRNTKHWELQLSHSQNLERDRPPASEQVSPSAS